LDYTKSKSVNQSLRIFASTFADDLLFCQRSAEETIRIAGHRDSSLKGIVLLTRLNIMQSIIVGLLLKDLGIIHYP
jgi:hypothetical protein